MRNDKELKKLINDYYALVNEKEYHKERIIELLQEEKEIKAQIIEKLSKEDKFDFFK